NRLHIIVPINQNGWRAFGFGPSAIDDRMACCREYLDLLQADPAHLLGHPIGGLADVLRMVGQCTNAWNADQVLQFGQIVGAMGVSIFSRVHSVPFKRGKGIFSIGSIARSPGIGSKSTGLAAKYAVKTVRIRS